MDKMGSIKLNGISIKKNPSSKKRIIRMTEIYNKPIFKPDQQILSISKNVSQTTDMLSIQANRSFNSTLPARLNNPSEYPNPSPTRPPKNHSPSPVKRHSRSKSSNIFLIPNLTTFKTPSKNNQPKHQNSSFKEINDCYFNNRLKRSQSSNLISSKALNKTINVISVFKPKNENQDLSNYAVEYQTRQVSPVHRHRSKSRKINLDGYKVRTFNDVSRRNSIKKEDKNGKRTRWRSQNYYVQPENPFGAKEKDAQQTSKNFVHVPATSVYDVRKKFFNRNAKSVKPHFKNYLDEQEKKIKDLLNH
jgi:hypothetical protein